MMTQEHSLRPNTPSSAPTINSTPTLNCITIKPQPAKVRLIVPRNSWPAGTYVNRCSCPFHFNKDRESPEVEATYTLYMYEALKAIKAACDDLRLGRHQIENLFHGNAARLICPKHNLM